MQLHISKSTELEKQNDDYNAEREQFAKIDEKLAIVENERNNLSNEITNLNETLVVLNTELSAYKNKKKVNFSSNKSIFQEKN